MRLSLFVRPLRLGLRSRKTGCSFIAGAQLASSMEEASVEMADLIYNGGRTFITSSVRLHIMRWTRFLNATASCLPSGFEVEIRGIPAHAWELSTAELLLDSGAEPMDFTLAFQRDVMCSS